MNDIKACESIVFKRCLMFPKVLENSKKSKKKIINTEYKNRGKRLND